MRPERHPRAVPQPGAGQPAPAVFLSVTLRHHQPTLAPLTIRKRAHNALE